MQCCVMMLIQRDPVTAVGCEQISVSCVILMAMLVALQRAAVLMFGKMYGMRQLQGQNQASGNI